MHPGPDELGPEQPGTTHLLEVGASLRPEDFDRIEPPDGLWTAVASRLADPRRGTLQ